MSNVPPQYHGSLATMMMQLGRDESMAQGSERAVQVGDRMFVFVEAAARPERRRQARCGSPGCRSGPSQQTAATGLRHRVRSGPSDIIDGRMVPPDCRFMGSPTI